MLSVVRDTAAQVKGRLRVQLHRYLQSGSEPIVRAARAGLGPGRVALNGYVNKPGQRSGVRGAE